MTEMKELNKSLTRHVYRDALTICGLVRWATVDSYVDEEADTPEMWVVVKKPCKDLGGLMTKETIRIKATLQPSGHVAFSQEDYQTFVAQVELDEGSLMRDGFELYKVIDFTCVDDNGSDLYILGETCIA